VIRAPVIRSILARSLRRTPFTRSKSPPANTKSPLTARARTGAEELSMSVLPGPSTPRAMRGSKASRDASSVETAASDLRAAPSTEEKAPPTYSVVPLIASVLTPVTMPSLAGPWLVWMVPSSRRMGPGFQGSSPPSAVDRAARCVRRREAFWGSSPNVRKVPPT